MVSEKQVELWKTNVFWDGAENNNTNYRQGTEEPRNLNLGC